MAQHRATGRAQVRPLRAAGTRSHRESALRTGVVKAGMLGALATATIAVPLAAATAGPGQSVTSALGTSHSADASAHTATRAATDRAPVSRDAASSANRSTVRMPTAADTSGDSLGSAAGVADMKVSAPEPEPSKTSASAGTAESSSGYIAPINAPITSGYGLRIHPVLGYAKGHDGVDFGAACGTAVHAAAGGTVVAAEYNHASGNRVKIDHGNGVITGYYHLSAFHVSVGEKVSQGQVVGDVGSTGRSTGCHLHFAKMDSAGTYSDPMTLLG